MYDGVEIIGRSLFKVCVVFKKHFVAAGVMLAKSCWTTATPVFRNQRHLL
jgi:hypothetical protein